MFEFFSSCCNALTIRTPYGSSEGHRNSQRINAGTEVVGTSLQMLNPSALIPTKLAQTGVSLFSIFRPELHASEKIVHLIQGALSGAQLGLAITMLFKASECNLVPKAQLCTAAFLLQLLYSGTLIAGWAPSEFSKDPADNAPAASPV